MSPFKHVRSALKDRGRREAGSTMVEAAFVFLPLFMLIFGMVDTSLVVFMKATFQHAVREGVRYAITYQTMPGMGQDASIKEIVRQQSLGFLTSSYVAVKYYDRTDPNLEIPFPNGNSPENIVEVSVTGYSWNWILPMLMGRSPSVPISARSADRMEGLGSAGTAPAR
jgi:hypothetical protein